LAEPAAGFASLEGKLALVTGASRGIGRAIATELAAAGAELELGYRSGKDEADELASLLGARAIQADVSSPGDAKRLVEEAGDVDVHVNNAGLTRDGLLARMSDDDLRAGARELLRDRAADPARGAGDERELPFQGCELSQARRSPSRATAGR
jgi:NAD(P)-dependent dehydrogenase (short-subunit alcohol dehydrogenase family)